MGVDFFPCDRCGESICDCGDYERCNDMCGRRWCDRKCAKEDGYSTDSDEYYDRSCKFCRNEDVEDSPLLYFILKHFNMTIEEAKNLYLDNLPKDDDEEEDGGDTEEAEQAATDQE